MGFSIKIKHIVILTKKHDRHETQDNSHTDSSHGERTVSYEPKGSNHSDWDCELESLRRQVKELELKARLRCRRRTPKRSCHDQDSKSSPNKRSSH